MGLANEDIRPLKRVEYERLVELDYFAEERLELLEGTLVRMSPQRAAYAAIVQNLTRLLVLALASTGRAEVRVQLPFAATDDSEPEPDIAVVPVASYHAHHPATALLIVEVSDTTLKRDRTEKQTIYAQAQVPEYWVVDVANRSVERFVGPVDGRYASMSRLQEHASVKLEYFPDVELSVADLFR